MFAWPPPQHAQRYRCAAVIAAMDGSSTADADARIGSEAGRADSPYRRLLARRGRDCARRLVVPLVHLRHRVTQFAQAGRHACRHRRSWSKIDLVHSGLQRAWPRRSSTAGDSSPSIIGNCAWRTIASVFGDKESCRSDKSHQSPATMATTASLDGCPRARATPASRAVNEEAHRRHRSPCVAEQRDQPASLFGNVGYLSGAGCCSSIPVTAARRGSNADPMVSRCPGSRISAQRKLPGSQISSVVEVAS